MRLQLQARPLQAGRGSRELAEVGLLPRPCLLRTRHGPRRTTHVLTCLVELDEELEHVVRDLGECLLGRNLLLEGSGSSGRLVLQVGGSTREVSERLLACMDSEMDRIG